MYACPTSAPCRYFSFTFLFFLAHQFALSLFRTIAAINRSLVLAYPFAWLMFLTILLLGGYILNKSEPWPWLSPAACLLLLLVCGA